MNDGLSRRDALDRVGSGAIDPSVESPGPPERYNVGIEPGVSVATVDSVADRAEAVDRRIDLGHIGVVITGRFAEPAREQLRTKDHVRYVEADGRVETLAETEPWGVDRIDADRTRSADRTGEGVTVAVLDSGIDDDHPDLPTPVLAKCFSDDCCGAANCSNGNTCNEPWSDDNDHGTHVAGTIAALDDTEGVVGVAPGADLMAGKVVSGCGSGSWSSIADGIRWAADEDADVINMSLGGGFSQAMKDACQYAADNDVVIVAAAGNPGNCSGCDCSAGCTSCGVDYPAAYDTVIAVSALRKDDTLTNYSAVGPAVELAAPGGNLCDGQDSTSILSTVPGGYAAFNGTSMASPHVAGAAALVKAETHLSDATAIRDRLNATAEDVGLSADEQGNGLVDVGTAVWLLDEWSVDLGSRLQFSSPAVTSTRVVVGGLDSTLHGLNRSDGSGNWQVERTGALADSSPARSGGGRVFVGSGGGTVYALGTSGGSTKWTFDTDSAVVSSPTIESDVVYVGTNDGDVFALDDTNGGAELWSYDVGGPVFSRPAFVGGVLYVTTADGEVVAIEPTTQSEVWRHDTGGEIGHAAPLVEGGRVFVAADQAFALDVANGSVLWSQSYGGAAGSTPAYDAGNDRVVVGGADGTVSALDPTNGDVLHTYATGDAAGSPVIVGDRVVVGSDDGYLYLLDAANLTRLSRVSVGRLRSAPTIRGGDVHVATWDGIVRKFANATS